MHQDAVPICEFYMNYYCELVLTLFTDIGAFNLIGPLHIFIEKINSHMVKPIRSQELGLSKVKIYKT